MIKDDAHYTKAELRAMLPKVGDRLERPFTRGGVLSPDELPPKPCLVVEVNTEHFWYRVRFEATGTYQCFKVPAR